MTRKRGARSIRGALGTYVWVSAAFVALLAVVLWLGPGLGSLLGGPRVVLQLAPAWEGATLEDDMARSWELRAGGELELPPGRYVLTLFGAGGVTHREELELSPGSGPTLLGSALPAGEGAEGPSGDPTGVSGDGSVSPVR